ncbi:hypothetical protein CBR_g88576 [Chara braunii]|uniref:Uncharacterized protein n=1 Tax=Chara braunii TaxID=69332 RepID=A0A388KB51_CHABU|nr:hypothetical protein CBR_g88576 [Chara braunii]|eukprot:GBG67288.1 hypothetical protein CBR_g88576 [Chara braunii]
MSDPSFYRMVSIQALQGSRQRVLVVQQCNEVADSCTLVYDSAGCLSVICEKSDRSAVMENQSSTPGFAREDDGCSVGVAHGGYHIQPSLVLSAYASDDCMDAVRQQLIRRAQGMQSSTSPLLLRSGLEGSVVGKQLSDEYMASATPHPLSNENGEKKQGVGACGMDRVGRGSKAGYMSVSTMLQDPGAEEESSPTVAGQEAVQEGAGEGEAQEAAEQRAAGGDAGAPRGPSASSSSTVTAVTDSTPASKRTKTVNAREQTMHVLNTAMREQTQAICDSANEQSRVSNSCTVT